LTKSTEFLSTQAKFSSTSNLKNNYESKSTLNHSNSATQAQNLASTVTADSSTSHSSTDTVAATIGTASQTNPFYIDKIFNFQNMFLFSGGSTASNNGGTSNTSQNINSNNNPQQSMPAGSVCPPADMSISGQPKQSASNIQQDLNAFLQQQSLLQNMYNYYGTAVPTPGLVSPSAVNANAMAATAAAAAAYLNQLTLAKLSKGLMSPSNAMNATAAAAAAAANMAQIAAAAAASGGEHHSHLSGKLATKSNFSIERILSMPNEIIEQEQHHIDEINNKHTIKHTQLQQFNSKFTSDYNIGSAFSSVNGNTASVMNVSSLGEQISSRSFKALAANNSSPFHSFLSTKTTNRNGHGFKSTMLNASSKHTKQTFRRSVATHLPPIAITAPIPPAIAASMQLPVSVAATNNTKSSTIVAASSAPVSTISSTSAPLLPTIQSAISSSIGPRVRGSYAKRSASQIGEDAVAAASNNGQVHKSKNAKKYKCDLCGRGFSRSNTLITHRVNILN
jgi:hypothetical protein